MTGLVGKLCHEDVDGDDDDDDDNDSAGLSMKRILRRNAWRCRPRLWPGIMMHVRNKASSCLGRSLPQWLITHLVKANISTGVEE